MSKIPKQPQKLDHAEAGKRAFGVALGILIAMVAIYYCSFLTGRVSLWDDQLYMNYPGANYLATALSSWRFPLWLSGMRNGIPFYSDLTVQSFYLPGWLMAIFVNEGRLSVLAYQWFLVLHVALAGLFMVSFLRSCSLHYWATLTGAVVFVFSAFISLHFIQPIVMLTFLWLPAELYFVRRIIRMPNKLGSYFWLAACIVLSLLGAFPQVVLFNAYLLVAYWVFLIFLKQRTQTGLSGMACGRQWLVEFIKIGAVFLVVILLGAVQFFPAAENWSLSSRQEFGFAQIADESMPWYYLIHGAIPNFFGSSGGSGGGVPFWGFNKDCTAYATWHAGAWQYWEFGFYAGQLALIAVVVMLCNFRRLWSARREHLFFLCAAGPILWLMLGRYGGLFRIFYHIAPGFSMFRQPARIGCLLDFCLAVTTAVFVDILVREKVTLNWRRPLVALGLLYGAVFSLFIAGGDSIFAELKNPAVWQNAMTQLCLSVGLCVSFIVLLLILVKSRKHRLMFAGILALLTFGDLCLAFRHFHAGTTDPIQYYSDHNRLIEQMTVMKDKMGPFRFAQLRDGMISEEVVFPRNMGYMEPGYEAIEGFLLFNLRDYGTFNSLTNQQTKLAIQNVRVIANADQRSGKVGVMVFTNSLPRVKFYHHVRSYQDEKSLLGELDTGRLDYWQTIGISADDMRRCGISTGVAPAGAKAEVRFTAKSPEEYQISYDTTAPGVIFVSESYYPGWEADGGRYPIIKAFGAFKGIVISQAGRGVITVRFAPRVFKLGLTISLSTLGILSLSAVVMLLRRRKGLGNS